MSQNPQQNIGVQLEEQKPIDTVVESIMKKKIERSDNKLDASGSSYINIYSSIKKVLSGFDNSITDCKKYNQAKIHRKYEIRIADLQEQIKMLKQKVEYEQSARDPSKKYVQKLIDQLVKYKNENEKLQNQNDRLKIIHQDIQDDIQRNGGTRMMAYKDNLQLSKSKVSMQISHKQDNPQVFSLNQEIDRFLTQKKQIKKKNEQSKSKFQIFLRKNRDRFDHITFNQFLYEIQEWSTISDRRLQGYKAERLRSNILSTLQDEISQQKHSPSYLPKIKQSEKNMKGLYKGTHSRKHYSTMDVQSSSYRGYTLSLK